MKLVFFSSILLFCQPILAYDDAFIVNKIFLAWSKQTGFNKEVDESANAIYMATVPKEYQIYVAIIGGMLDTYNKKAIRITYSKGF